MKCGDWLRAALPRVWRSLRIHLKADQLYGIDEAVWVRTIAFYRRFEQSKITWCS